MVVGKISWISGPVVKAEGMAEARMYEVAEVGEERLIGEVIGIEGDVAAIQVYETTSGIRPGEPVFGTGMPLSVTLGPGIVGETYDGIQRPLEKIALKTGAFIGRGITAPSLDPEKKWLFTPTVKRNEKVRPGQIIGTIQETPILEHRVMIPPTEHGTLEEVVSEGDYTVQDSIATLKRNGEKKEIRMSQRWPVRRPRPYHERLHPSELLVTGQRIIDTFFPISKGGTSCIPGGFGTGKTIMLHQFAAWANAKVILYIGCGERGNEMTEVLVRFPELKDPYSGRPLMEKTVLIANTSNMPVAAREASIYTGITIAEYLRDMGHDVLLVADSTSRWAEAVREISNRLEEMPAEEGYPSYLASRLAEFYERAGRVKVLGNPDLIGSVSVTGAVSPPGGDFTEPVTTHTLRFTEIFWALDTDLAYSRHYPAVNWMLSYSGYVDTVEDWWSREVKADWRKFRETAMKILLREDELRELVRLLGPEALPDAEKLILDAARMLREGLLQQHAYDPVDTYCLPAKQFKMLKLIVDFYDLADEAIDKGVPLSRIRAIPEIREIFGVKYTVPNDKLDTMDALHAKMTEQLRGLTESREEIEVAE